MSIVATENKSANVFRRFLDGWVPVYLFIFVVTLCVRLFLFENQATVSATATNDIHIHSSVNRVIENSVAFSIQSSKKGYALQNPISFESEKGLTQN